MVKYILGREYLRGKYHCTIDLLFDWFGLVCFANRNKNCQQSCKRFQTGQTGGQLYCDTSPFSIPCSGKRESQCCGNNVAKLSNLAPKNCAVPFLRHWCTGSLKLFCVFCTLVTSFEKYKRLKSLRLSVHHRLKNGPAPIQ